jgi:hypothetical protein
MVVIATSCSTLDREPPFLRSLPKRLGKLIWDWNRFESGVAHLSPAEAACRKAQFPSSGRAPQDDEALVTPNRAGFINLMNSDHYVPCEPLRPSMR